MSAMVTVQELKDRCDWTFDADEDRVAGNYLIEVSDLVRAYGKDTWDAVTAPRMVKNIVISVVRRYMRNPEGYLTSRAGDETVTFTERAEHGVMFLNASEIALIRGLAGQFGFRSATVKAWDTRPQAPGYYTVPVSGYPGEKPFPYFSDPWEPW